MTQDNVPDFIPVIMSYGDGIDPVDIAEFVKALYEFHKECQVQYKGQKIKYYLLPEEQIQMLSDIRVNNAD